MKNIKKALTNFLIVATTFSVLVGAMFIAGGANAKTVYEPLSPQAEKTYQTALKTLCNAELTLTQAKIMDNANNALSLTPEQVGALVAKKQTLKCDTSTIIFQK